MDAREQQWPVLDADGHEIEEDMGDLLEESLSAARGVIVGVILGGILWFVIIWIIVALGFSL
jgi:hypothetical protein